MDAVTRRQFLARTAALPMLGIAPAGAVPLVGPLPPSPRLRRAVAGERPLPSNPPPQASAPSALAFVDYQGWIVTVADRELLRGKVGAAL